MTAFSERTRFVVGDEVAQGERRGVVVWSDGAGRTGQKFPVVKVTTGYLPGEERKPVARYPWRPLLDHEGPATFRLVCDRCSRRFTSPGRIGECRTCWKRTQAEDGYRDADLSGDSATATFHGRRYTPVTGQVAVCEQAPAATAEQRAVIDRGRVVGDDGCPF